MCLHLAVICVQVLYLTTSTGSLYTSSPNNCVMHAQAVTLGGAPVPSLHAIAKVSNRFCGFDADTRTRPRQRCAIANIRRVRADDALGLLRRPPASPDVHDAHNQKW